MKKTVIAHVEIAGSHSWPNAPQNRDIKFLAHLHRHIFVIRAGFSVSDSDRELEIFEVQAEIENFVKAKYESNRLGMIEFGHRSCEMIAEDLLKFFQGMEWAEVLEDGKGGARVER